MRETFGAGSFALRRGSGASGTLAPNQQAPQRNLPTYQLSKDWSGHRWRNDATDVLETRGEDVWSAPTPRLVVELVASPGILLYFTAMMRH